MSWLDAARVAHVAQLPELGLPSDYVGLDVAGIPHANVRAVVTDYLEKFWSVAEQGVAPGLFGRSGSYKSWAACVIAERVHTYATLPTLYVQCGPEFNRLERRRFDASTELRLDAVVRTPLIVLDDITDVKPNTPAMDMLADVVKQRDAAGVPTLYTGNADFDPMRPGALVNQFGSSMTRRILEGTKGYLLILR